MQNAEIWRVSLKFQMSGDFFAATIEQQAFIEEDS